MGGWMDGWLTSRKSAGGNDRLDRLVVENLLIIERIVY
jgi:allantoicase